jgi:hypothetical protein
MKIITLGCTKKRSTSALWDLSLMLVTSIACLASSAWTADGYSQAQHGLATNRAWVGPMALGWLVIGLSALILVPTLIVKKQRGRQLCKVLASLCLIGSSPTVTFYLFLRPQL